MFSYLKNRRRSIVKVFLKTNYDYIYIGLALLCLLLDWISKSVFFEGATFILVFTGFIFVTITIIHYPKDERIAFIAFLSGYYSFMVSLILVSLFSLIYRFSRIPINLSEILRYYLMIMWCLFSIIFTIAKRKV